MTTPEKKISAFGELASITENARLIGNQDTTGPTGQIEIPTLRERLNTSNQIITGDIDHTGDQETSGNIKAGSFEGNGANITGVVAAGTGGTSSTSNLSLVCNSDDSTPAAKMVGSKFSQDLWEADENGFKLRTGIPLTHEDDLLPIDKDTDHNNKELIRNQTILNQTIDPYYRLNGLTGNRLVSDDTSFAEMFKYGGTYVCPFKAITAGEGGNGIFFEKVHGLRFVTVGGQIRFTADFSTTNGTWVADITLNKNSILGLKYNGLNVSNDPILYVDGLPVTMTETQAPVGTITTDVGTNLYFDNRSADDRTFNGNRYGEILLNRELSNDELQSITSNRQIAFDEADEGASNADLTSGTLTIGKNYRIDDYQAGDDFTNVGAASNATGVEFIATGTTPTTWTNSSVLHQIGVTLNLKGKDFTAGIAKDSSGNGNHATVSGATLANKSEQETEIIGTFTAGLSAGTSGTITLNTAGDTLAYRKKGRLVNVWGTITVLSVSSPVGDLTLTGLPYTTTNLAESSERAVFNISCGLLAIAAAQSIRAYTVNGVTSITIRDGSDGTGNPNIDFANHIQATTEIWISGNYLTDE